MDPNILCVVFLYSAVTYGGSFAYQLNQYTTASTGCTCYFDSGRSDCACCDTGGCQCYFSQRHKCVQCGNSASCVGIDFTNCFNGGVETTTDYYKLTTGSTATFSANNLCQLLWMSTSASSYNYSVELKPGMHPGVIFNWQDKNNYEYFYVRPGHPSTCFVYGTVINGVLNKNEPGITCPGVSSGSYASVKAVVASSQIDVYINDAKIFNTWNTQFSSGFIGAGAANGYTDIIYYRNLYLKEGSDVMYIASDCKYQRIKAKSEGKASFCAPAQSSSSHSSQEACLAAACAAGTVKNAINVDVGISCYLRECGTINSEADVSIASTTSSSVGRDVWIRDLDNCGSSNNCKNGATCVDGLYTYTCTCVTGYTGYNCETDIDDCSPNPCSNGATCTDGVNSFTCQCVTGYNGTTCQTNIDECSPNPCTNGAACTDGVNSFTCQCVAGYSGTTCETNIDECSPNPCSNGGTCTDGLNSFTCQCVTGYTGTTCQTNIDYCSPNPCSNGATCTDGVNSFTCQCVTGYNGTTCQTNINDCAGSPCNNGTCIDGVNTFSCNCDGTGSKGTTCNTLITSCADTPCMNGATCDDNSGITCTCAASFSEQYCQNANSGSQEGSNAQNGDTAAASAQSQNQDTGSNAAVIGGAVGGTLMVAVGAAGIVVLLRNKFGKGKTEVAECKDAGIDDVQHSGNSTDPQDHNMKKAQLAPVSD